MSESNDMLKSLGGGVNLDITQGVEKQVRQMLAALKNEIESTAKQTGTIASGVAKGLADSAKQMEHILSVTSKAGKPVWLALDEDALLGQGDFCALRDIEIAGTFYSGCVMAYSDEIIELVPQCMNRDMLPENSDRVRAVITPQTLLYVYDNINRYEDEVLYYEITVDDEGNALGTVPTNG